MESLNSKACKDKRLQKNKFLQEITDYRNDLFKYCRKLTNNPWDAEDLVQETLVQAYGKLADKHSGINNIKAYLFRMATNQWIDWCRRSKVQFNSELLPDEPYVMGNFYEIKDAIDSMIYFLAPKERVAFVLSEAFESKNEEIAEILGTTEGAVKSALNRSRVKLKSLSNTKFDHVPRRTSNQEKIVNMAVDAFNRRDLDSFSKLFVSNAIGNAPGCFFETNLEEIKNGSLFYTINTPDGTPQSSAMKAEKVVLNGDVLFVIFHEEIVDDVWKFTIEDDSIERFDCYYCCPEVLSEIATLIGKKVNSHGYYYEQG
ncbi:MAG: RNA polymerase sigma factor [Bacteriovorax sp.]|nr:RNA polymerase sigma factor [Bacteriovorax sp.]